MRTLGTLISGLYYKIYNDPAWSGIQNDVRECKTTAFHFGPLLPFIRSDHFYGSDPIKLLLTKNMCVPLNAAFHVINLKIPQEFIRDSSRYDGYMCVFDINGFCGPQEFFRIWTLREYIFWRCDGLLLKIYYGIIKMSTSVKERYPSYFSSVPFLLTPLSYEFGRLLGF